jgi:hypothetical protein
MSNIFVLEATNGVGNGIHVPDVIQELVPQPFAFAGSPDETRNIEELKRRGGNLFGMNQLGQAFQPFIGHRDDPGVRIDGAEPIVRHFRSSSREGVKDRRFSNVGKTYDSATKTHGPSGEISVSLIERELLGQRCRPAFAEAPALRKASGGGATRSQAQGCSEDRTGPSACHFSTLD